MASANAPQSIADWYHSCIAAFERITASVDNLAPEPDSKSHESKEPALQLVQDQIGRLRVWAGNMGAHRPAGNRMSLDYKLKEASHIQNTVVELLEELSTSLETLCSTQENLPDPIIEQAKQTDGDDGEEENDAEERNDGAEENDGEEEDDGEQSEDNASDSESAVSESPLSNLVFQLDDTANIISCLYALSVAMRQPVPQDRLRKYAEIDLSHYEFFDYQHALEKFPKADPLLIRRLGYANTQRRQYFKYRLLHHETISSGLEGIEKAKLTGLDQGHRATNQDTRTVITAAKTSTTISIVPKSAVVPALDTIETESEGGQTAATSLGTITETENSKVKLLKVPDPPDSDRVFAGDAFQCPYCYSLIIVRTSRAWRRHVFRDLRPYACTFDSCTKSNRLFETRHGWYDHEERHHRREWYCAECTVAFSTSSNFTRHLKESHPALLVGDQDVSTLAANCERPLSTPQQCPLCTIQSEHTAHRLRSHLGRHMQQLALFTLPRLEIDDNEGNDIQSEAGLIGRESSDEGDEEEMSDLEFDSNPSEDRGENEEESGGNGEGAEESHGPGEGRDGFE
ncbi:hypothetical protein BGX38DRAFT_1139725 [Terfezia claveryi]|nr:hypothetical protein BGX38DRAFT_1139725 [Terfezia claveryi]